MEGEERMRDMHRNVEKERHRQRNNNWKRE
jgi:hypothetical protein